MRPFSRFADDFAALARAQPDAPALVMAECVIAYGELYRLVRRCLALFKERGLKPGDCVVSLLPNSAEALVAFYACAMGGMAYAPLPCTATKPELDTWVALTQPKLCLITGLVADATRSELEQRAPTVLLKADNGFDWLPQAEADAGGDAPLLYISTSGTTGEPKAIVIDSNVLWNSGKAFMTELGIRDGGLRFWNFLPMSYLGGLYNLGMIPLGMGASVVIDEPFSGKTFLNFWPSIERYDITVLWVVPTIVRGLLTLANRTKRNEVSDAAHKVKHCLLGTAPIDLATKQQFEQAFGLSMLENFALSETTFITSETLATLGEREEHSVGRALPYVEVKLQPLSSAQEEEQAYGEIAVRSPFLFKGYLQADGSIASPVDTDGYLATGDLGVFTKGGTLKIMGRARDIIKKGGYLVPLREIEILAQSHPEVAEAAAVKVAHEFYGESFHLFLKAKAGVEPQGLYAGFNRWLHQNLVKHKWPEKVVMVEDFPRTASGKIRKHALLETR